MNTPRFFLALAVMTAAGSIPALTAGTVTTTADSGVGSLRAAISAAVNGETITFAPGLNGETITLTSQLVVNNLQMSIDASALPRGISVSGNNAHRVLQIEANSNVTLKNLDIRNGNAVESFGGGIAVVDSQLHMMDCIVRDCYATYSGGGLILTFGSSSVFDRCRITGNSGSATSFGGGINIAGASSTLFRSCVIAGNSSPFGGGLAVSNSSPQLINCTVQGNKGGGLRNEDNSDTILENTVIWGNSDSTVAGIASQQINNFTNSNPIVSYCLIEGASETGSFSDGNATAWGLGNINGALASNHPKFAEEIAATSAPHSGGTLSLLTTSPALNIGNNLSNSGILDLYRNSRVKDSVIDLGAIEGGFVTFAFLHPSLTPAGDANGNGLSNFLEYATGIDPTAPDNSSVRPKISTSGGFRFLTSSQRSNAADTTAVWQTSTILASSSWQKMLLGINYTVDSTSNPTPSRQQVVLKLLDADSRRFYRQGFPKGN